MRNVTRHIGRGKISVFPYLKKSYQFLWVFLISCFHKCYQRLKSSSSCSVFIGQSFPPCVCVWRVSRRHPRAHTEHACRRVQTHTRSFPSNGGIPRSIRSCEPSKAARLNLWVTHWISRGKTTQCLVGDRLIRLQTLPIVPGNIY